MAPVTLERLRERALEGADMAGSDFISQPTLDGWINRAVAALWERIAVLFQDYFTLRNVALELNGGEVELPEDFWKLVRVEYPTGNGGYLPMGGFGEAEARGGPAVSEPRRVRQRVTGARSLWLDPPLSRAVAGRLHYIPLCPTLVEDDDTVDFPHGWEEVAVLEVAIKCATKEEADTSGLEKLMAMEQQRIDAAADDRDIQEPVRTQDATTRQAAPRRWRPGD